MKKTVTLEKLLKIMASLGVEFDPRKITENTSFEDLNLDSLERYEFGYKVEEKFGIDVSDEKMAEIETFRQYMDYIKKHIKE